MADNPEDKAPTIIVGPPKPAADTNNTKQDGENKSNKKAKVSEDATAIVDRLTAEGLLFRNSGTNSIRSVKIELGKFDSIFQTISNSLIEQTELLAKSLNLTEIRDKEADERRQAIDDAADTSTNTDTNTDTKNDKKETLGDKLKGAGKASFDFIKSFAKIAGSLFIGYNLLKGMVDKVTDGKFTEYETKLKEFVSTITRNLGDFSEILTNPLAMLMGSSLLAMGLRNNFKLFGLAIETATGLAKGMFAAGGLVMKALGLGTVATTGAGAAGAGAAGAGNGENKSKKRFKAPTVRGLGLAAAAGVVINIGATMLRDEFEENGINSKVAIGEAELDLVSLGESALQGAAFGAMFGPVGALVGAVGGAAISLGGVAADYIKGEVEKSRSKLVTDMDNSFNVVNTDLAMAKTEKEKREAILKARTELDKINDELLANEESALAKSKSTAGGRSNKGIRASGRNELKRIEEQKLILEESFKKLEQLSQSVEDGTFIPIAMPAEEIQSVASDTEQVVKKGNRRQQMQAARLRKSIKRQVEEDIKLNKVAEGSKENVNVTHVYNNTGGSTTNIKQGDDNSSSNSQAVLFSSSGGNSMDPDWVG